MKISPPQQFNGLAVADVLARNWTQDTDGTQRRMGSRGDAMLAIANGVNFALARIPRVVANHSVAFANRHASGTTAAPLWQFSYNDTAANGRDRLMHVLFVPRVAGSGDCEAYRTKDGAADTADTTGVVASSTVVMGSTPTYPRDISHAVIRYERGARDDALETLGITAANGFTILGLVVQEEVIPWMDSTIHDFAPVAGFEPGKICSEHGVESLRTAMQTLREDYLPVLASWCGNDPTADAGGSYTQTASDASAFVVQSTSYVNIFDGSSGSRTATTPGISCHVQYAGHGPIAQTASKRVLVGVSILCNTSDGAGADIVIEGPDGHASNTDVIAVTALSNAAPTWVTFSTGIYLDSGIADDSATTARNKIDIAAKTDTGAAYVRVFAWRFQMEHI